MCWNLILVAPVWRMLRTLIPTFFQAVRNSIIGFVAKCGLKINLNLSDVTPNALLSELLEKIKTIQNAKILILIDEYDHFTSELLGYNKELFEEVVFRSGYFRKFFEVLKIGTKTIIDRIFFTGANPFTLDNLTSGFNNSTNLALHPKLGDMMGFGEEEIRKMFESFGTSKQDFEELLPVLKNNYDGYKVVEENIGQIYNSDMVLYFAKDYFDTGRPPKNLIDENIASSYSKIKRFIELSHWESNLDFIRDLIEDKEVNMQLTTKFEVLHRFTADDFKSRFF